MTSKSPPGFSFCLVFTSYLKPNPGCRVGSAVRLAAGVSVEEARPLQTHHVILTSNQMNSNSLTLSMPSPRQSVRVGSRAYPLSCAVARRGLRLAELWGHHPSVLKPLGAPRPPSPGPTAAFSVDQENRD